MNRNRYLASSHSLIRSKSGVHGVYRIPILKIRDTRSSFYCIIVILLILILYTPQTATAENDFPIGLQLDYEYENRYGFNSDSYTKSYDFIRWTDDAQTTVEIQIDSEVTVVPFPDGEISVMAGAPLWTDISDWSSGMLSFKGRSYEISEGSRNGYNCWYLHAGIDGSGTFDGEYWNLYYERTFGFLVFYGNIQFSGFSTTEVTVSLEESNLDSYKLLGGLLEAFWIKPLLISSILVELVFIGRLLVKRRNRN